MQTMALPYDGQTNVYTWQEGVGLIVNAVRESGFIETGKKYKRKYYNEFMTFDIETTKLENELFIPETMPEMYHYFNYTNAWAVYIGDYFIFGREIADFFSMLAAVQTMVDGYIMTFVHNLAYEYNNNCDYFMRTGFQDAFFRTASTPLYVRLCNFEFRCTAQLTHKSLRQLGFDIGYEKLTEYEYDRLISPRDELSELDINYSLRDVKLLYLYVRKELKGYAAQTKKAENPSILPLTQTGYVRRDIKKAWSGTNAGYKTLQNVALTEEEYHFIRPAFYGGYVHANFRYIGKEFRADQGEKLLHVDLKSAYPWAICTKNFALKLTKADKVDEFRFREMLRRKNFCVIADITIFDICLKKRHVPYLPADEYNVKSVNVNAISENGKLVKADALRITLCDTDARLLLETYDVGEIEVNELYFGVKRPLPYAIVATVISYFCKKTEYKDKTTGDFTLDQYIKYLYQLNKGMLNSIYGLFATACEHIKYMVNTKNFATEPIKDKLSGKPLVEYKESDVLPYQIALQITAYVREAIMHFCNFLCETDGCQYWYSDTDSVFCKDTPEAREYVNAWNEDRKADAEYWKKLYFDFVPLSQKGKPQILGAFDIEDEDCVAFCSIGAKRYYLGYPDGTYEITFSGMRATKRVKVDGVYKNGPNTQRLIDAYKTLHKAFLAIMKNRVKLPYLEGIDKLGHYNVRAPFVSHQFGWRVTRPCTYTLYGQAAQYALNPSLKWFLQSKEYDEILEEDI